jgi:hypothetical protein
VIGGTVLNDQNGSPILGAKVSLMVIGRGGIVGSDTSDAAGHYEIRVPPEKYSAQATKDGFVTKNYKDVADFPVIEADAGKEAVADFRMIPGSTISGKITDMNGSPIPNVGVMANVKRYLQGKVDLWLRASTHTNAQGEYRLANLPSGRYFLQAIQNSNADKHGREFEAVFYPAAAGIENAGAVRLAVGAEKRSIDFRLRDATTHSVSGIVTFLDSGLPVPNMAIQVYPDFMGPGTRASIDAQQDGTFRLDRLTAGRYRMEGRQKNIGYGAYFLHFFEVTSSDIQNMAIHVEHGLTLKGTLQASGGRLPKGLKAQILYRDPVDDTRYAYAREASVSSVNGAFEFMNVHSGIYDLRLAITGFSSTAERKFFVSTITMNGRDVTDTGIAVPERSEPLQISASLDFQPGSIFGRTFGIQNKLLPGARLALMSADPKKRLSNDYWKETRSDRDGSFRFSDLIPGDYLLIIWPTSPSWEDSAGLDSNAFAILEQHAVRVRVERALVVQKDMQLTGEVRTLLQLLFSAFG